MAVLVAICAVLLLLLAAFAVDVGNAYANNRQLSVAADAAALAAAAKVGESLAPGTQCTAGFAATAEAGIAKTVADQVNAQNNKANGATGSEPVDSVTVTCTDPTTGQPLNYIEVTVKNSRSVKTSLATVIGITQLLPNDAATARYVRQTTGGGLRPWAVCAGDVQAAQDNPNTTFQTWLDNKAFGVGCLQDSSGNWGAVDFDGGNNNANDLAAWTLNGYSGFVSIPDPLLPADPGVTNSNDLRDAFQTLINQVVTFPVVTAITGGGNNATFDAVGVITAKVCGIRYGNSVYNSGSTCWDATKAAQAVKSNGQLVDIIQYRWVDYTGTYVQNPNGATPPNCALDNRLCAGAVQLYR